MPSGPCASMSQQIRRILKACWAHLTVVSVFVPDTDRKNSAEKTRHQFNFFENLKLPHPCVATGNMSKLTLPRKAWGEAAPDNVGKMVAWSSGQGLCERQGEDVVAEALPESIWPEVLCSTD